MNIGLIGLEKSGKTTIFNALAGASAPVSAFGREKPEPKVAVVPVLDSRIEQLTGIYRPRKTVHATVEIVDFAGLTRGTTEAGILSGTAMAMAKATDALALVVRNFREETLDQVLGLPDPAADVDAVVTELLLADQIIAERRLERISADIKKGKKTPELQAEERVLESLVGKLDSGIPVSGVTLSPEDAKRIRGFQFLTAKPLFVVLNSSEDDYGKGEAAFARIHECYPVIEFAGKFEMELSQLDGEEAAAFMQDVGIAESARSRLTSFAYRMLGYLSFFTVGEDEVRAWTLGSGETALEAAGTIHSDLARGFIRTECFTYSDILEHGSEDALRKQGKLRLEGKTYVVQDGDILSVRFSV